MDRNGNRTNSGVNDVNRRLFENAGTDWAVFDRRLFCHGHHHQTGKFLKFARLKKFVCCRITNSISILGILYSTPSSKSLYSSHKLF